MEQPTIRVDLRRTDGKSPLKAYADITLITALGEITIRGSRVVQKDGQGPWVALPSASFQKDGILKRMDILEARRAILNQIKEVVLTEYNKTPP